MTKIIFKKPANSWEDASPLGNGFLGAMVLGNPNHDVLYMNEDSLYSGWEIDRLNKHTIDAIAPIREALQQQEIEKAHLLARRYLFAKSPHPRHYEPLGQVHIEAIHPLDYSNYSKELTLDDGTCSISYTHLKQEESRTCFISYPANELFYQIEGSDLNLELYLMRRSPTSGQSESYLDELELIDDTLVLSGYNGNKTQGIEFAMGLNVHSCDGVVEYYDSRIVIKHATKLVIGVTGRTSIRSENPRQWCLDQLSASKKVTYDILKTEHITDFSQLFNRSTLNLNEAKDTVVLPDALNDAKEGNVTPSLSLAYFNFGKYLLISSSRKGSFPANLQGIWSKDFTPPWGSRYTININTQMNYWFCEKLGLSELHFPLFDFLKNSLPNGKKVAKSMYGADGAVLHHNTDIFGDAAPSDFYMPATIWPMGGIWLSLDIIEHFEYSLDDQFLSEYSEVLLENWKFLNSYLFEYNGTLNTGPSVSPENTYITNDGQAGQLCISPTMDIQIIRDFLTRFGYLPDSIIPSEIKERNQYILNHLPATKINSEGCIMEWQTDYQESEPGHRHISHLFGLFPGNEINELKNPELFQASLNTLERRLANGGGHTGWSCAWIINFFARLNRPTEAFNNFEKLLVKSTLDNLLDNHPPFQIDGNFGAVNGILEMIVHDFGTTIHLLPALPKAFETGSLKGYQTKSGLTLDIYWENSTVTKLSISAERNTTVTINWNNTSKEFSFKENNLYSL